MSIWIFSTDMIIHKRVFNYRLFFLSISWWSLNSFCAGFTIGSWATNACFTRFSSILWWDVKLSRCFELWRLVSIIRGNDSRTLLYWFICPIVRIVDKSKQYSVLRNRKFRDLPCIWRYNFKFTSVVESTNWFIFLHTDMIFYNVDNTRQRLYFPSRVMF